MKTIYLSPWQPFKWGRYDTRKSFRRMPLGCPTVDIGGCSANFVGVKCLWIEVAGVYAEFPPYNMSYPFRWGKGNVIGKSAFNTMKRIDRSYVGIIQRVEPGTEPYMLVPLDAIKFDALSVIA